MYNFVVLSLHASCRSSKTCVNVLKIVLIFYIFSIVQNINSTTTNINSDLNKISDWAFQWKMNFNLDPNKQAQEVIFSGKFSKINHLCLLFNQNLVKSSSTRKHLGMVLDTKLDFHLHLENVHTKQGK